MPRSRRAVAREGAQEQVVLHRHLAEQLAPLRHQAQAVRDARLDASASMMRHAA